jgi:hypothetical protein
MPNPAAIVPSQKYAVIQDEQIESADNSCWRQKSVADVQDAIYKGILASMYAGQPRIDLVVAAEAVRDTGLDRPILLEVGCGSGYYGDVFRHLLGPRVSYVGLDYSAAMIGVAKRQRR